MKVQRKEWTKRIDRPVGEICFFIPSGKLDELTPEDMELSIGSDLQDQLIYPGLLILESVRPLWGIAMDWTTEITAIGRERYSIDDLRLGPFALWNHQHHFIPYYSA